MRLRLPLHLRPSEPQTDALLLLLLLPVVRLLDVFEDGARFCLVLELLGDAVLDVALWGSWRRPLQHASRSPQHKLHSRVGRVSLSPASAQRARAIDAAPALSLQQIRLVRGDRCRSGWLRWKLY